ncbi:MAG: DNA-directed RNA polymerase subunit omega [Acidobacteriales bacterium]|nr:DNA-directed RNA polymerase subunit omega [Terriglobales bacterium]
MKIDGFDSKYRYIHVAARRARQLQSGAPALVKTESRKASKVAQDEIDAGLVNFTAEEKPATPLTPAETHFDGGSH